MKKIIAFLVFIISLNLFSQETIIIKGKLFFSPDFYNTFNNLLVKIDDSKEYIKIEKDGGFEIKTSIEKDRYKLLFYYYDIKFKEFNYKFEWTKRNRPKSISLAKTSFVNKSVALKDFRKKKKYQLYIFNRIDTLILSEKDKLFQKNTNSVFVKISMKNMLNFDNYLDYNIMVFKTLALTEKLKFLNDLREDVIGYNYRYNR